MSIRRHLSVIATMLLALAPAMHAADQLELSITAADGTGDPAMYVAWIETTDGAFVKTFMMFSKDKKYYKDMTIWEQLRTDAKEGDLLDGMISPTLKWSASRTVSVPVVQGKINLLSGKYVLRFEQRKDKAGHYKKTRFPLTPDFTSVQLTDQGYLATAVLTLKKG